MRAAAADFLYVVDRGQRRRWVVVLSLAVFVSVMEMLSGLLVFGLLQMIAAKRAPIEFPLIGSLEARFPGVDPDALRFYTALAVAAFFLVRGAVTVAQLYVQNRVVHNAGVSIAHRLLRDYLAMPYAFHLRRNSAELIRNATDSTSIIVTAIFLPLVNFVSQALLVLGLVAVLLVLAPVSTLLSMVILGSLVWVILRLVQPRVRSYGETDQAMSKIALQAMQQSLQGIRDITLLGRHRHFEEHFRQARSRLARARYLSTTLQDVPRIAIETGFMLFIIGFFTVTLVSGDAGRSSIAVLGMFAYALLRVMPSLNRVVVALNTLPFGAPALELVSQDLRMLEGAQVKETETEPERPLGLEREIALENVSFRYAGSSAEVLQDVSLAISRGEAVGFVGATGSGKSTCVDLILGLLEPTSGRVLVDGADLRGRYAAWHRSLGVVSQTVFLTDDTLRRNIAFGEADDAIDELAVRDAVRLAQLEQLVAQLPSGLETEVGERGVRLSGGQRQRVAIARALYRRPSVLVFDEGTAALDTVTESEIVRALEELRGDRTIVMVAHRLTTVRNCDRIALFEAGRIVDVGSYEELQVRNAHFRRMTV